MESTSPTPALFRRGVLRPFVGANHATRCIGRDVTVRQFWGQPRDLADGVGVLLLTWNQAFYRYGAPNLKRFEDFLTRNGKGLEGLRNRDIATMSQADEMNVCQLFESALESLETDDGTKRGRRSPVAAAKTLHLLAPRYFPLWDQAIAKAYRCAYSVEPAASYIKFMRVSRDMVREQGETIEPLLDGKTHLKVVDGSDYSRFTKKWV